MVNGNTKLISNQLVPVVDSVKETKILDKSLDNNGNKSRSHKIVWCLQYQSLNYLHDADVSLTVEEDTLLIIFVLLLLLF